jgi:hypothetical protein
MTTPNRRPKVAREERERVASDEILEFMGKNNGFIECPTTVEILRFVTTYIRVHNLQCPTNHSNIIPDAVLNELLRPQEQLTYFNLMRHIKHHILPKASLFNDSANVSHINISSNGMPKRTFRCMTVHSGTQKRPIDGPDDDLILVHLEKVKM